MSNINAIKRLRTLRKYLTELNDAGVFSPGNAEYECIIEHIGNLGCGNPFTGNAPFNAELDSFLLAVYENYGGNTITTNKIDALCEAL